jgi:Patatin-like phospholipase
MQIPKFWLRIYHFFPLQLLLLHFKKNTWMVLIWGILFGFVFQQIGTIFGIPYLFLDPEYNHRTGITSLFIMGVAVGGFTISYQITCYILDAHRFPFLGNEMQPFSKFALNNSLLPLTFIIVYLICFSQFQLENTYLTDSIKIWNDLGWKMIAFLLGFLTAVLPMSLYFVSTNQDVFKLLAKGVDKTLTSPRIRRVNVMKESAAARYNRVRVDSYLDWGFRIRSADTVLQDLGMALRVLRQNHLNGFIIQMFVLVQILILGFFRDSPAFQLPAAASVILFFTLFMLLAGSVALWLGRWANPVMFGLFFLVNAFTQKEWFESDYNAFGLDYKHEQAPYTVERLRQLSSDSLFRHDRDSTLAILQRWRKKFPARQKPVMVLVCTSGGGQRAAVWTMRSLQFADSVLQGNLMPHTTLITGASGGLVGASYFRELYLRQQTDSSLHLHHPDYLTKLAQDNLNSVAFSLVVSDLLIRSRKFEYNGFAYYKDRGYAFEQSLNRNTGGVMDKRLKDYAEPERLAKIPMLILSPTVVNDGRKLYISSQAVSYMTVPDTATKKNLTRLVKGIEFRRFFEKQKADDLRFLSALRMSATFPYITPNVSLPSEPEMEIMDAGLSDNFGINDAVRFLYVFREWIAKNTRAVVVLSIRDTPKDFLIEAKRKQSLVQKIFTPIGSLYTNWQTMQDYTNDNSLEFARSWFKGKLYRVDLQYAPPSEEMLPPDMKAQKAVLLDSLPGKKVKNIQKRASLSWRLTEQEKQSLRETIHEQTNRQAIQNLEILLK